MAARTAVCASATMASDIRILWWAFFFFQAEDGIRDGTVTGVQTWLFRSHRALRDRRVDHAGKLRVDAIADAAGDDVGDIDTLDRLAGDLPVLRILERHFLRRRELRGFAGDLAEARLAAARAMRDHAVGRRALGNRRVPALGGGGDQHFARAGAGFAQVVLRLADGAA